MNVSRRLVWSLVAGIALCVTVLIASNHRDPIANLLRHDVPSLFIKTVAAVFAGTLFLLTFRDKLSKAIEAIFFWAAVGLVLIVAYAYRFELRETYDRVLAELVPGRAVTIGRAVEVVRAQSGDFSIHASINGARVTMVLDTGASSVVLTHDAAKAAGLPVDMLAYTVNVDTANGRTRAAPVTLDRLVVGGLTEREVPALVARQGQLRNNLLGMSFLNRLESWEVRGDKLRLHGLP